MKQICKKNAIELNFTLFVIYVMQIFIPWSFRSMTNDLFHVFLFFCSAAVDLLQTLIKIPYFLEYSPGLEVNPGQLTHPN